MWTRRDVGTSTSVALGGAREHGVVNSSKHLLLTLLMIVLTRLNFKGSTG